MITIDLKLVVLEVGWDKTGLAAPVNFVYFGTPSTSSRDGLRISGLSDEETKAIAAHLFRTVRIKLRVDTEAAT